MLLEDRRRRQQRIARRHAAPTAIASCQPACSSSERCIADMNPCATCPPAHCVSLSALELSTTTPVQVSRVSDSSDQGGSRVGLIAGLTTGLGVVAVIIATVAGFVFYRRRKQRLQQEKDQQQQQQQLQSLGPPPPVVVLPSTAAQDPFRPAWSATGAPVQQPQRPVRSPSRSGAVQPILQVEPPQSPVFMGTALQIPRLTTPPSTATTTIRQSLNMTPSSTGPVSAMNRSSSVKVTKYDYRTNEAEDDFDDTVQIRRAVSVKKNGLSRSASVGAHPQQQQAARLLVAKPTMVRIVTRTEGGVTRKASVRSANPEPPTIANDDNDNDNDNDDDGPAKVETPPSLPAGNVLLHVENARPRTDSWVSQQSGEITVIWDRHDDGQQRHPSDEKR